LFAVALQEESLVESLQLCNVVIMTERRVSFKAPQHAC